MIPLPTEHKGAEVLNWIGFAMVFAAVLLLKSAVCILILDKLCIIGVIFWAVFYVSIIL